MDDEPAWLRALSLTLESSAGITNVFLCEDSRKALPLLSKGNIGLVILDLTMPHISGEEILAAIAEQFPETACIIISGVSQLDTAVRCMKLGAFDYSSRPMRKTALWAGCSAPYGCWNCAGKILK